jgi:hypothetical protein
MDAHRCALNLIPPTCRSSAGSSSSRVSASSQNCGTWAVNSEKLQPRGSGCRLFPANRHPLFGALCRGPQVRSSRWRFAIGSELYVKHSLALGDPADVCPSSRMSHDLDREIGRLAVGNIPDGLDGRRTSDWLALFRICMYLLYRDRSSED